MSEEPPQSQFVPDQPPYRSEHARSPFVWKSVLRSTGSLGQRWLRRKPRQDWVCHPMAPGVDLVTFWLDERLGGGGTGVCMSVFCRGYEVLRFDCFGGALGHFHITPFTPWAIFGGKERRLQFREQSAEEQVERALFEITENLDFYLQLNPKRRVRRLRVDRDARRCATEAARQRLQTNLAAVPELQGLTGGYYLPAEGVPEARALPA
ncbi:MAG: hypothetical protein ACNA7W_13575 [Pseudomonadales bacterium]